MNNAKSYIDEYNANVYIELVNHLHRHLPQVEEFLRAIQLENNYIDIDDLVNIYKEIFEDKLVSPHINFKVDRIYKALYLRDPGPHDKGNSYFHLTLLISSTPLLQLDNLYGSVLSRLIKFYKHLFSKVNNFFISLEQNQLNKYEELLKITNVEISKFLEYNDYRSIIEKREKLPPEYLTKIPFAGLFYIAHIKNLKSILTHGILSHNKAHGEGLVNFDISNKTVNERRNRIEASLGGNIHDFTPLFIHPRNPTFYYWCQNEPRENLILLKINPHILLANDVAFSDGNAAVQSTQFYHNIEDFNRLNWTIIKDAYWTHHMDGKRIKCSEVLVRDEVPLYYINEILVYCEPTLETVIKLFPNHLGIKSQINKAIYF